ncbi:MAG: type IV pilus secretin PilQ, partial [Nevskiales bacterium]
MRLAASLSMLCLCAGFGYAMAQTLPNARLLQSIEATGAGDAVSITLQLSGAAPEPAVFSVANPARLSIDLPDTSLGLNRRYQELNQGVVKAYAAAEGTNRTRVVLELTELSQYNVQTSENSIVIQFGAPTAGLAPASEPAPAAVQPMPEAPAVAEPAPVAVAETPEPASLQAQEVPAVAAAVAEPTPVVMAEPAVVESGVLNIDFRRGEAGEGRVLVTLSDPDGTEVDVDQKGGNIVVEFKDAPVRDELIRRLDVLDFATPIKFVDTERSREGSTITVQPIDKAYFEQQTYLAGNQFIIELRPLTREEEKELEERTFRGERISLNFQSIDIRAALRIIADVAGVNLVVSDKVQGEMALRLDDVPWDQALDIILTTNGLGKRLEGNVLLIAPLGELAKLQKAQYDEQRSKETLAPLVSEIIRVNFAKAAELATLLEQTRQRSSTSSSDTNQQEGLLSTRGSVTVDERTNTMLVTDTREKMREIRRILEILDVPIKQVLIESRIVVATDEFSKELGAQFAFSRVGTHNGGIGNNGENLGTSGGLAGSIGAAAAQAPALGDFNVALPAANPAGRIGLAILGSDYLVGLELSAMQAEGDGEIISTPRVLTANASEALIKQGFEVPFVSASQNGTNVQFKDAVLELKVTPQITPDDRIIMDLNIRPVPLSMCGCGL